MLLLSFCNKFGVFFIYTSVSITTENTVMLSVHNYRKISFGHVLNIT